MDLQGRSWQVWCKPVFYFSFDKICSWRSLECNGLICKKNQRSSFWDFATVLQSLHFAWFLSSSIICSFDDLRKGRGLVIIVDKIQLLVCFSNFYSPVINTAMTVINIHLKLTPIRRSSNVVMFQDLRMGYIYLLKICGFIMHSCLLFTTRS